MSTVFPPYSIFTSSTLSLYPPPSHWTPQTRPFFFLSLPVLHFLKKTFLFAYDGYTGSFTVTFPYAYMYYAPDWFIPLLFSPFYLSPLLMVISAGFSSPYSHCIKVINHIHLLYFLHLPSPPLVPSP
jgi:hypothetical protein